MAVPQQVIAQLDQGRLVVLDVLDPGPGLARLNSMVDLMAPFVDERDCGAEELVDAPPAGRGALVPCHKMRIMWFRCRVAEHGVALPAAIWRTGH